MVPLSDPKSPGTPVEIARYFLALPSGRILVTMTGLAAAARLSQGGFGPSDLLIAAVVIMAWPFMEWVVHIFWLHGAPIEIPGGRIGPLKWPARRVHGLVAKKHRIHHQDPWRLDEVMLPLQTYLYTIPALLLFWFGLFPAVEALTGLTVISALGLHYELVHLMAHCRYRPRSGYYLRLWRNHRLHHCKSERHWLGVTMLLGDRLLGTGGDPDRVDTSPTCRTLGQDTVWADDRP